MTDSADAAGRLFYDAECRFCVALAERFRSMLAGRGFTLAPLQTPGVREQFGFAEEDWFREMRLISGDGRIFGGADACIEISRHFWWTRPFFWMGGWPVLRSVLRSIYRCIARHRHCAGRACRVNPERATRSSSQNVARRRRTTTFFESP